MSINHICILSHIYIYIYTHIYIYIYTCVSCFLCITTNPFSTIMALRLVGTVFGPWSHADVRGQADRNPPSLRMGTVAGGSNPYQSIYRTLFF